MDKETKAKVEMAVAWTGPIFVVTYFLFWGVLGHNIPPPNFMGMTGAELVSEYYGKYQTSIAVGMIGSAFCGLIYLPWSCLLSNMLRDEDGHMGVLSLMELTGGTLTAFVLAFCPAILGTCAVLANELDPNIIKSMHAFSWIIYDCTFMVTTVQLTGLGCYTVLNKSQKIFPAWAGWFAIAVGIIFIPLLLIPFVPNGPFAVGGMWNFFIVFGTWLFGFFTPYSYYMLKEVSGRKQQLSLSAVPVH